MGKNAIVGQSGGPTSVINASLAGVFESCKSRGAEIVYGMCNGVAGLLEERVVDLSTVLTDDLDIELLKRTPSSFLGSCRYKLPDWHDDEAIYKKLFAILEKLNIGYFFYIGGNDSMDTIGKLAEYGNRIQSDIRFMGVPKTIDNDIWGTDFSFGFDSAVSIATDAIDRLHSTASSHKRVMVIEVMGHKAGWIALYSGMAGGGDVILIPELSYNIHNIGDTILNRLKRGKPYSIVVVAEGIQTDGRKRAAEYIAQEIEYETGIETRETVLGYIQRGGSPTPFDRNLSTRMGGHATELIAGARFGRMVTLKGNEISSAPLEEIAGKLKLVTEEHDLVVQGKRMGICFG